MIPKDTTPVAAPRCRKLSGGWRDKHGVNSTQCILGFDGDGAKRRDVISKPNFGRLLGVCWAPVSLSTRAGCAWREDALCFAAGMVRGCTQQPASHNLSLSQ